MKKLLSLVIALTMLLSLAVGFCVNAAIKGKSYTALKATPIIDGETDDIWNNAEWTIVDRPNSLTEPKTGSTLKVKLLWDDEKLYFLAEVHDTDHNEANDAFEIYVDQKNDKLPVLKKDDIHTRFKVAGGVIQNSGKNCQNDAPHACKQNGDDFTVEGAIEWTVDEAPVVGQMMGLEFMYNDGGEDKEFLTALRWNVDTANGQMGAFTDTSNWGTLILADESGNVPDAPTTAPEATPTQAPTPVPATSTPTQAPTPTDVPTPTEAAAEPTSAPTESEQPTETQAPVPTEAPKNENGISAGIIAAIVAVAVAVIAVIAVVIVKKRK